MSEIRVTFPGNKRVNAEIDGFTVATDQPKSGGGDGSAPSPFDYFLASLATCAGIFVLGFCQKRGIPTEGIELRQSMDWDDEKHLASKMKITIQVPPTFPDKYKNSLINAAELCTVKRHMQSPPQFEVVTEVR